MKRIVAPALASVFALTMSTAALVPTDAAAQQFGGSGQAGQQLGTAGQQNWQQRQRFGMHPGQQDRRPHQQVAPGQQQVGQPDWQHRQQFGLQPLDPLARQALNEARYALLRGDSNEAERALQRASQALDEGEQTHVAWYVQQAERALEQDDVTTARQALQLAHQAAQQEHLARQVMRPGGFAQPGMMHGRMHSQQQGQQQFGQQRLWPYGQQLGMRPDMMHGQPGQRQLGMQQDWRRFDIPARTGRGIGRVPGRGVGAEAGPAKRPQELA